MYNSGLGMAFDKSFPLEALAPLLDSTGGGVAARAASPPSPKLPGDTASVPELFQPRPSSEAFKDAPLRAKASPTVIVVDVLSRHRILPLGSSRGVRRFPRLRAAVPPPDGSLGGVHAAFVRCVLVGPSVVPLLRREGRLRLWTQLLDPGRLCIDARLDFEGNGGVPSSFPSSSPPPRESGPWCRCRRPPACSPSDGRGCCCGAVEVAAVADAGRRPWSLETGDPTLFSNDRSSSADRGRELAPPSRSSCHSLRGRIDASD